MRTRSIVILTAALLLATVILLPRIIEAKRLKALSTDKNLSVASALTSNPNQDRQDSQDQKANIVVTSSYHNDTSIPLRDMKPQPAIPKQQHSNENPKIPNKHKDSADPVVQDSFDVLKSIALPNMPSPILNFNGIAFPGVGCNCAPPDTNGEVGATQYVQIVNEGYQVFNKTTGASVLGPVGIQTIWTGFGGPCETAGDGDPVVLYDQLANRWVVSQFAGAGVPTDECVAVSTTSDATGSYNRYGFHLGTNFFDYPHLGVWPDAYYMSMNVFNSAGTAFLGPQPFAFDRAKMLAGQPATFITTGITGGPLEEVYLPADLDGSTLPPAGTPASFVEFPGGGSFRVFHFHVDFATPLNSTFTLFGSPASAGFTVRSTGVSQLGTTSRLDAIGDRLMFRVATRFFADGHEAAVGNFTVNSGGVASVRWFELRNTTAGPVTVFQQGTYQPDTTHRWMGSAAMDRQGNIAVGYSASSSTINPQIRYAGRLAADPINTLPQAEVTLFAGTGSQTGTNGRWGDYSDMTIDPVDDCTFWYTQEYYATTTSFAWRTRIGSFKYPGCGGAAGLTASPSTVTPGGQLTVNWTAPSGSAVTDWIGLYIVGASNMSPVWWKYTGGTTSGSFNLTAPSTPGQYEFRYLPQDGYTDVARSNIVTVGGGGGGGGPYTLAANPSTLAPGDQLSVSWTAPGGRPFTDWIGLYIVGASNMSPLWWKYTGGTTSGSFNLTAPSTPGQYEFRYLLQDGYTDAVRSEVVTIGGGGGGGGTYTLSADPNPVTTGAQLSVSWTAPVGSASTDWIGLYIVGASNMSPVWWKYTGGTASGTHTLSAPAQAGQYEFRYLLQNGYTAVAQSSIVTVQ